MQPNSPVVCVVEDDAAVRNALKFSLEVEGLAVRLYDGAASLLGDPGLPSCRCLVVDFRMPVMDGLELAGVLRMREITAPVIMITGRATRDLRLRAEKLGVRQVIEKPLPDGELVKAVQAAIAGEPLR
ncbi:MAG: response regulator [Proteobacteria bacterium]|nr:response regulator [Pseudomonadota bacterium]